ncbi:MAG: hypothetical protein AAGA96_03050 [Verrucomicrobiota bacterium]
MAKAVQQGETELEALDQEAIDFFVSFVQTLGLPRSIGQIYGFLFVSTSPMSMDDIVRELRISKGSASQGLATLRNLGAVHSKIFDGERCERYEADFNVSRIVNHFFRDRLEPQLKSDEGRIAKMVELAEKSGESEKVVMRLKALQKWQRRGLAIVPMIIRWLKR